MKGFVWLFIYLKETVIRLCDPMSLTVFASDIQIVGSMYNCTVGVQSECQQQLGCYKLL